MHCVTVGIQEAYAARDELCDFENVIFRDEINYRIYNKFRGKIEQEIYLAIN
jgi:hypothetical protein